jgi:hypothetical protein
MPLLVYAGVYLTIAALVVAIATEASDPVRWYAVTILAAGAVLLVVRREARVYGMVDVSNPVVMSLLASVLFFGVLGAPNVFPGSARRPLVPAGDAPMFRALATVGASMLFLWIGSRVVEPVFRPRQRMLAPLRARIRPQRVLVVVIVGAVARFVLLLTGNLGYQGFGRSGDLTGYSNWLATANDLLPFAAGLLLLDWFSTRRKASLHALIAVAVVETATSIVSGVKGLALSLLVFLAVVAIRSGRRPSLRVAAILAAIFLLIIAPSVEAFRAQVQRSGAPTSLIGRITEPLSLVGGSSRALGVAKTSYHNTLLEEQNLLVDVVLIQTRTPSVFPFEHGRRWLRAPVVAAVPRALWRGKPSFSNGADLAVRYAGAAPGTTSMPATMVGDAWIQFGWLGVIGGSLALGAVYRLVYVWVARRRNQGWTLALCFVVAGSLFSAGLDLASLVTSAARVFLVLAIVASWVLRPATRDMPAHPAVHSQGQPGG